MTTTVMRSRALSWPYSEMDDRFRLAALSTWRHSGGTRRPFFRPLGNTPGMRGQSIDPHPTFLPVPSPGTWPPLTPAGRSSFHFWSTAMTEAPPTGTPPERRRSALGWWGDRSIKTKILTNVGLAAVVAGTIGSLGMAGMSQAADDS